MEPESAGAAAAGGAAVGRLVDCSQADDRRMIRLVRARRLLYARNNMPVASYYSQVKSLWEEVADEMGWSVGDVRRKWSHIRNSYSRHLRNELGGARTGRGRAVSRWYLADELEFLREHMATDTRPASFSPYSPAPATFLEMDMSERSRSGSPPDVKPFAAPWFATAPTIASVASVAIVAGGAEPKQEPHSVHSEDSGDAPPPQPSALAALSFAPDEDSSYFQFFRGLYNDYCELSPRLQRRFKRQCLGCLHRLLDGDAEPDAAEGAPVPTPAAYILPND